MEAASNVAVASVEAEPNVRRFWDRVEHIGKTVTLIVGPTKREFAVDKATLFATSEFFEKAFTSPFKEGQTQTMNLPDEDPHVICLFLRWLYAGYLETADGFNGSVEQYLMLFILADMWQLPKLQAEVYQALNSDISQVWEELRDVGGCFSAWKLVRNSPIRFVVCRLAFDMVHRKYYEKSWFIGNILPELEKAYEPAFANDVVSALIVSSMERGQTSEYELGRLPEDYDEFVLMFGPGGGDGQAQDELEYGGASPWERQGHRSIDAMRD